MSTSNHVPCNIEVFLCIQTYGNAVSYLVTYDVIQNRLDRTEVLLTSCAGCTAADKHSTWYPKAAAMLTWAARADCACSKVTNMQPTCSAEAKLQPVMTIIPSAYILK